MRKLWMIALMIFVCGCSSTGRNGGVDGGTGLTLGRADACRPFREALLAREHLIVIYDASNPDQPLLEGTATFQRHDKFPDKLAYRRASDKTGDQFERHEFQLVPDERGNCRYSFFDEETKSRIELDLSRDADHLVIGSPELHGSFRLSPNIIGLDRRRKR